ncbi:aldehyde dehydrogenase family protein [Calditerricola satsumensis]|uniref:Aldehyde dehydrogenase n=2 Tax=Calditerricola satsumensis TaxID=373054 RepID=A0A8J3B3H1_9BACI|nr:aldehyde dehydrogenase family protein [Calditerricola satsumensis]GGJ90612.1 aldehyde dehydrogenase [Calditerricola satsumensis]
MTVAQEAYRIYVDGEWAEAADGQTFVSVNPANTDDVLGRFPDATAEDAERAIEAAHRAYPAWAATPPAKRSEVLLRAADLLERRAEALARELTREEGKVLAASRAEVKRAAATLRFYAMEGLSFAGETLPSDDPHALVYTVHEPLGVVTVITPWNFPLSIPARKIAPALVTGNTVVFKPASDTPLMGLRLVEAFVEAGLPPGVLNLVTGSSRRVGLPLVAHPLVKAVTFTGSTAAGEAIHRAVALTTRTQMELGGKNPLVVLDDADLDLAVDLAIKGGYELTGQACTATSRVLVHRAVHDAFVEKLAAKTQALHIGSGLEEGVDLGPLANGEQLETVLRYVRVGCEEGATLVCGGERLSAPPYDKGYFVRPAVFAGVTPTMRIAREEIFGPVIAVIAVDSLEEALDVANGTDYGLSAAIVTRDVERAQRFARGVQAGVVKVNRPTTGNALNAPFGGVKKSSTATYRESGRAALAFFTQTKTVYLGW